MGLIDGVKGVLGDLSGAIEGSIARIGGRDIPLAFAKFYPGGLEAFLDKLRADGHGAEVGSWLEGGEARPISEAAIASALPEPVAERMAQDLSLPHGRLATALSEFLPGVVAGISENGRLKPQPVFKSTQVMPKSAG